MDMVKRKGDNVPPWNVPRKMESVAVLPCIVMYYVFEAEYSCLNVAM